MGSGTFSYTSSAARAAVRRATGKTAFLHNQAARAGLAPALHPTLDLRNKPQRESRDIDGKLSFPIACILDQTGSMSDIPPLVVDALSKLGRLIYDGGVLTTAQIAFGAVGDANPPGREQAPVQMGEFEVDDARMEAHLANLYLEANGGGQGMESYELFLWFFAHRVFTDAWEKRRQKGLLYLVGDEAPYPTVARDRVRACIGLDIEKDAPTSAVARQVQEKWDVFLFRPGGTHHYHDPIVQRAWSALLPSERILQVENWEEIVPMMAGTASLMAGRSLDETVAVMQQSGFDTSLIRKAAANLNGIAASTALTVRPAAALMTASGGPAARGRRL